MNVHVRLLSTFVLQSTSPQDEAALLESIGGLDNPNHRIICQHFIKSLEELEALLKRLAQQLAGVRVPLSPDGERVNHCVDHCQVCLGVLCALFVVEPLLHNVEWYGVVTAFP